MQKAYLNWSGGKDCCLTLHTLLKNPTFTIDTLVTSVNSEFNRISMHGVRKALLEMQVESLGMKLHTIELPGNVSMTTYDAILKQHIQTLQQQGLTHSVFGDIFLEDLRAYREKQLELVGIKPVFPLWKKDTRKLVREFIDLGYKAIVVCTNAKLLDKTFCGVPINEDFLKRLPEGVDPCGENGEFHTFVYDGPIFKSPIIFSIGEKVLKSYQATDDNDDDEVCGTSSNDQNWDNAFWYCDLIPKVDSVNK
ncbi:diphthine--ammonia ligase [Aquimarina sp. ERC-38]|uniref:Dph6-related ATP pyrophosphatase n=1 Tax=Aquimarina sp. ERC-38 TaxID=2949996 RepID=UPI0022451836|nr:diphthine--ammonia ligase [Aquimarina sp. ERC-38]UZO79982.1 diphthine--ammonia ligase [Aquimarina sp. ERC-38]